MKNGASGSDHIDGLVGVSGPSPGPRDWPPPSRIEEASLLALFSLGPGEADCSLAGRLPKTNPKGEAALDD